MTCSSAPKLLLGLTLFAGLSFGAPVRARGQVPESGLKEAYFRAISQHFEVPLQEVNIIGDWDLAPDEVPVVFFLSRRAGVSPDALIGARRNGRSWLEVSTRFGLGPGAFHLPLPEGAALGPLTRANDEFRSRPPREWGLIQLSDEEVIAFVNTRFLSERVGVAPGRVLEGFTEAGTFMAAYLRLRGG